MSTDSLRHFLPSWLTRAGVGWAGLVLAALALVLAALFAEFERRELVERELNSTALLARVLEDHASRGFGTAGFALGALAEAVRAQVGRSVPARLGPMLTQTQQGLPLLRSVSLLDPAGRVLASSNPANLGLVLDLTRVPLPAPGQADRLGPRVPGRDLAEAAAGAAPPAGAPAARSFMSLAHRVDTAAEPSLYLVAVLNIDYFANAQQQLLDDESRAGALVGLDGTLLAATDNIRRAPGEHLGHTTRLTEALQARERDSYLGTGIDGKPAIVALRLLRQQPLAVVVEHDYADLQAEVAVLLRAVAAGLGASWLVIGLMVALAWRSLGHQAAACQALEDSQARVAASERELRTLVQSVHELVFRTDTEGRVSFVNDRWAEVAGSDPAQVLGQHLARLCVPADQALVEALFLARDTDTTAPVLVRMADARGTLRTLELSVAAVRTADRCLTGYAGLASDVTERQLARQRLQAQLDFSARLIEVSPTPLFVKDAQGRFITVNRAWLDLMLLSPGAVIGRDSSALFGADAPVHMQHDQQLLQSGERLSYDNQLVRPDGEVRDTVVTKLRFTHADGTPAGIIGSIIDVTEFREAERSTREARDAAERANRAKSEFIANISHELRTPLQSIIGFSELGADMAAAQPRYQDMFQEIHAGGRRMLTLVNGLLDVAKIESAIGSLALQRQDLTALVLDVVQELRLQAAQRGLQIVPLGLPRPLPADVDAFRIQQVIRNVLANALRFAPEGSRIEIRSRCEPGTGIELTVRDHGPGIPAEELESIFEAFVQSSRTADGSGGTGLGLTICRKIMGAHGGRITAANAEDGGALMCIQLPWPAGDAAADAAAEAPPVAGTRPDIELPLPAWAGEAG